MATTGDPRQATRTAEVSEFIRELCVAYANIGIYSTEHPLSLKSVQQAYQCLTGLLGRHRAPVGLALSEKGMLFEGLPVEARNPNVARLIGRLRKLNVQSLHFIPGLTEKEFTRFLTAFTTAGETEQGSSLTQALAQQNVTHVTTSEASYVLVTGDKRVVSRSARVTAPEDLSRSEADQQIATDVARELLKKRRSREWLVSRAKNNPTEVASALAEAMEEVVSHPEHSGDSEDTVESIIGNIRLLGEALVEEQEDGEAETDTGLREAVMMIENEIKTRSSHLMSGQESRRVINEILGIVATFTDQLKAMRATEEFVKDEATLRSAEALLRRQVDQQKSGAAPAKLRKKVLKRLASDVEQQSPAPGKSTKSVAGAMFEETLRAGLAERIDQLGIFGPERDRTVDRLKDFVAETLKTREKKYRVQLNRFAVGVRKRECVIDNIGDWGIVIWAPSGQVEYMNETARRVLGTTLPLKLDQVVMTELRHSQFPLPPMTSAEAGQRNWNLLQYRFLTSLTRLIHDADGTPVAALLAPPKS